MAYGADGRNGVVRGFTLIELIIAIAIVGILAGIAFPFYQEYVLKARRSEAMVALTAASNAFERYRAGNNFTYAGACVTTDDDCDSPLANGTVPDDGAGPFYELETALSNDNRRYVITARPTSQWASRDSFLQIDSSGAKSWENKKDGKIYACWPQGSSAPCDPGAALVP